MFRLARRWLMVVAVMALAMTATAQTAAARYAGDADVNRTIEVCADSLTHHLFSGGTVILHYGHNYYVTGFSDNKTKVWGINQGSRYGWVYNGYFC